MGTHNLLYWYCASVRDPYQEITTEMAAGFEPTASCLWGVCFVAVKELPSGVAPLWGTCVKDSPLTRRRRKPSTQRDLNQQPLGYEACELYHYATTAASRVAPLRGTRMKDSALIWRGINKAKHPAGFEPTTSWLWGMCSAPVQQLLPRPQVQFNFLIKFSRKERWRKENFPTNPIFDSSTQFSGSASASTHLHLLSKYFQFQDIQDERYHQQMIKIGSFITIWNRSM